MRMGIEPEAIEGAEALKVERDVPGALAAGGPRSTPKSTCFRYAGAEAGGVGSLVARRHGIERSQVSDLAYSYCTAVPVRSSRGWAG